MVLTQNDIEGKVDYPDKTAAITWDTDLHYPDSNYTENSRSPSAPARIIAGSARRMPFRTAVSTRETLKISSSADVSFRRLMSLCKYI